jgi:hypothetical protein
LAKYEYKVYNAKKDKELRFIWKNPDDLEIFLNDKGQDGWDLISERDMGGVWTLIFQREILG